MRPSRTTIEYKPKLFSMFSFVCQLKGSAMMSFRFLTSVFLQTLLISETNEPILDKMYLLLENTFHINSKIIIQILMRRKDNKFILQIQKATHF